MHVRPPDRIRITGAGRRAWRATRETKQRVLRNFVSAKSVRQRLFSFMRRVRKPLKPTWTFRFLGRRALRLISTDLCLYYPDLPAAFDGYRILHLSDLHLDHIDATDLAIIEQVANVPADLCVMTGDFRDSTRAPMAPLLESLAAIITAVQTGDGIVGVLGNHDSVAMVEPLEELGMTMLLNESITLARGGDCIHLTGLDDVHQFRSEAAEAALGSAPDGFAIALVHSPEIVERASERHRLYLTGHTHGGQICLPGGRPIITSLKRRYRSLARGLWVHAGMIGYTSCGVGAAGLPIRVNCPAELVTLTLRRGEPRTVMNGRTVDPKDHRRVKTG